MSIHDNPLCERRLGRKLLTEVVFINQLSNYSSNMCQQPASYQCNVWHDFYTVLTGVYSWAFTESYKDLGDKNRGVQEGKYFYGINRTNIVQY